MPQEASSVHFGEHHRAHLASALSLLSADWFLDGKEGFIFHFLQAYRYRLLVDIKLDEIRNVSRDSETPHGEACEKHP